MHSEEKEKNENLRENSLRMNPIESHSVYLVIIKKKLKVKSVGDEIANITDGIKG